MKHTKRSLLFSVTSLILCFTMLFGSTYAWFTDLAESSSNIIQTGTLNAELYWSDSLLDADSTKWQNADGVAVFTHDNWEPGYTEVKYLKVKNAGKLSFAWKLSIEPTGNVTALADVIDVYYVNPATNELTSLSGLQSVGNLSTVIEDKTAMDGVLLPEGETSTEYLVGDTILAIAFHMQETAGNDYQVTSLGDGFSLKLLATQFGYEQDGFGSDYDANAGTIPPVEIPPITENSASAPFTPTAENTVDAYGVSLMSADGKISASIPEGVAVVPGATHLTLTVNEVDESQANFTLGENETTRSLDVHIDGIAANNQVPMKICLHEAFPVGLNFGNYRLYHVENGQTFEMSSDASSEIHNSFYYEPETGNLYLYLRSFSEVALVADTENAWEGNFDYNWYNANVTQLTIANADQLAAFGAIVGGMAEGIKQDSFVGKTVKLIADINLGDAEENNKSNLIFYPIGYNSSDGKYEKTGVAVTTGFYNFCGTFDGNGNTVSNFYHNTWEMKGDHNWYSPEEQYYRDGMGLFGKIYGGTVKNLTVSNFSSDGEIATTGVIAAYADGATFENIAIFNCNPRVYNIGNGGIVGCVGWYAKEAGLKTTFKNITVDNSNKISALWGSYDVPCGGILGQYYPTSGQSSANYPVNAGVNFENCHVSAQMDVYNDVCANYQYYAYRYAGMLIGSIRENTTNEDGKTIPDMTGISATGCTVNYGDWNDYYYCEFEKNGHPSYSGPDDYKFSRVPHSELNFTDSNGNGVVDADERASVTGCKHDHTDAEDNQAIYLPFYQLFTGYSWGVSSIGLEKYSGIVTNLDITEGDQEKSVEKFEKADNAPETYRPGQTINVGDLFKEIAGIEVPVVSSSVYVSVSPATENDKGSAIYTADTNDWSNGTITFADDCVGALKIVITDYFFCTKTVIVLNAETTQEKFTAQTVDVQNAYTQINLGDLFTAIGIQQDVTATVLVDGDAFATINGTAADWASKTIELTKDGTYTVTIKENDAYCEATTVEFTVKKVDKFESKFTGDFLYRVGNGNAVAWTSLFADLSDTIAPSNLSIQVTKVAGNAAGTFDGSALTVSFTGTGVVTVTIEADGANPVELQLEVVDATNVAENGKIGNYNTTSVLLGNTSVNTLYLNGGATLYGNGFTIDCTNSPTNGSGSVSENYIIALVDAHLDNVNIIGAVYTTYGAQAADAYNRALVVCKGNSTITNCYLSNTASPIRLIDGTLCVKGTTVKGGNFANIDIRSGHLTIENVTTINQALGNDNATDGSTVIGLGIVVYYEMVNTSATSITVKNGLKQYNHISSADKFSNEYANQFVSGMFNNSNSSLQYVNGTIKWINTGIILMTNGINVTGAGNKSEVSFMGATGSVYTTLPTTTSIAEKPTKYSTLGQGVFAPSATLQHNDTTKGNYIPKEADKNDYCYFDGEKVLISMDQGDSFQYDPFILNPTKSGNVLSYIVKLNGTPVASGNKISFNTAGEYTITYTYEDPYNYRLDKNGNLEAYTVSYVKTDIVSVAMVEPKAEHAKFTFGTDYSTTTEEILYNNNTYISASGVVVDGTTWGKITVGDKTIVYPIVAANVNKTASSECQVFYYVFNKVIKITDANGTVYSHDNKTGTDGNMPSNLKVIKGNELKVADNVFKNYNDSNLSRTGGAIFKYSSSSQSDSTVKFNNSLAYQSPSGLTFNQKSTTSNPNGTRNYDAAVIAQYQFTDSNGATYYYYVGYHITNPNTKCPSGDGTDESGCVTSDTLITLADGTQKRIDQLTYTDELLVWDFYNGCYATTTASVIYNHGDGIHTVTNLHFSDGTTVKMINEHEFFDVAENSFVYISQTNVADYIGHEFIKVDGNGYKTVTLEAYSYSQEETGMYTVLTAKYNNAIVEGMLSLTPDPTNKCEDFFRLYEVGEGMKYDEQKMLADIEQYGLFTYEDLSAYVTYEEFVAFNGEFYKILVGKGYITVEDIVIALATYAPNH